MPDIDRLLPDARFTHQRPHDYSVEAYVENDGSVVVFRAKIGKLTVPPEQWEIATNGSFPGDRRAIRNVEDCEYYACQIEAKGAMHYGVFILRPSRSRSGHFVLAGYWTANGTSGHEDLPIWELCENSEVQTVRLC